ncbi:4Fe-4S binding protein [Sphaerisporangium sp. NBC_01403]|uniref:4Fe-4S binding protein n=1 Tax=Sphaerisporangium sp. NBC_01403 TaxID=2903599 RepID=UPI00324F42F4
MLSRADTQQYPEVRPDLPPRSRGVIALVEENCTVCMLCARECPDWCIYIDSHKETAPAPEGGRPRAHNVLDRFAIDFSLCMYCGICIEVCPFDALFWSPEFEYAEYDIRNLLHEKDKLGEWVQTIPIPPPHEPNAEPPKEVAAASRGAARPTRDRPDPERVTTKPTRPATSGRPDTAASGGPDTAESDRPETLQRGGAAAVQPSTAQPDRPTTAETGDAGPTPADHPGTAQAQPGQSGDAAPDRAKRAPGTPGGGPSAPRRGALGGHAAVRAIRPPGALPKKPAPTEPPSPPRAEESPGSAKESGTGEEPPESSGAVEES